MSSTIFTDGTIYSKSKLDMINQCLLVIGEVPLIDGTLVDSLQIGTDGDTARRVVETVMVEVQSKGWYFNTDYNFKLVPDSEGFITMPPNTLRIDFGNTSDRHRYVLKNGSIYDYKYYTFVIDNQLEADITWLVDYDTLPTEAYEYIAMRAARKFQQKVIGSTETDSFAIRDEGDALVSLQRRQLQSQDYKILNDRVSTRIHNGYLQQGLYGSTSRRDF